MSSDTQDIEQSLTILLSTTPGERLMKPDFGCRINQFVFEELTQTVLTQLASEIRHAILFFESRINVEDVHFLPEPISGKSLIQIDYSVITTNTRSNMVYLFYLKVRPSFDASIARLYFSSPFIREAFLAILQRPRRPPAAPSATAVLRSAYSPLPLRQIRTAGSSKSDLARRTATPRAGGP